MAQARGNRAFHLGGGRSGKDDSLLAFEGPFSPRRHEFHVGRWVLEPAAYRALCDQRRAYAEGESLVAAGGDEEFFPRYRMQLTRRTEPASPNPAE